jgi:hypothetical protein
MTTRLWLLAAVLPCTSAAQPTRDLGQPMAELATPTFSSVTGIRELSDGRLLVVDRREGAVLLLDFTSGTSQRIGQAGSGPGEVAVPTNLLGLTGDTSAVWDSRNNRLFFVDPPGTAGRSVRLTADNGSAPTIPLQAPRYADASGRLYFAGVPSGDGAPPDSLPILRFERRTARFDTVGMLARPKGGDQAVMGPPGARMTVNLANPFSPREDWVVTADGRVGVVRSPEYRLDWTHPSRVRGREIPFARLAVTEADKEHWRRRQRGPQVVVADVGARGTLPSISSVPEPTSWPKYMPPFLAADRPVLADGLGRVWVARARSFNDSTPLYDVFDAESRVVMQVRLPQRRRVVGFGRDVVYTVRADDDDLLRVARHALPR